jgi:hypothetical protein
MTDHGEEDRGMEMLATALVLCTAVVVALGVVAWAVWS